jgi:hypothetical protein
MPKVMPPAGFGTVEGPARHDMSGNSSSNMGLSTVLRDMVDVARLQGVVFAYLSCCIRVRCRWGPAVQLVKSLLDAYQDTSSAAGTTAKNPPLPHTMADCMRLAAGMGLRIHAAASLLVWAVSRRHHYLG